ncbi:MAG: hypothetical protein MUE73_10435 [Planctomycetes bacterium]|jgi:hypothetical protein|nr:hypothetical protein [Planctomycetota bacterium]
MRQGAWCIVGGIFLLVASTAASAQDDVLESVNDFLRRSSSQMQVDWPIEGARFKPFFSQKFVYDDNIWQNDDHEGRDVWIDPDLDPITGDNGPQSPRRLTRGREWDVSSETTARLAYIIPVNDKYIKLFDRQWITLLEYEATVTEFLGRGGVDYIDQKLDTDLFGFLTDLLNVSGELNNVYYEGGASWSDITDPLDINVIDLYSFYSVNEEYIRRTEWNAFGKLGWRGNLVDAWLRYDYDRFEMDENLFEQADHEVHTIAAEIGMTPPELGSDKRVYTRYSYEHWRFMEQLLNNAGVHRGVAGIEGLIFTKKLEFMVEAGGVWWGTRYTMNFSDPRTTPPTETEGREFDSGKLGTAIARVRLEFRPWDNLKETKFVFEGHRDPTWSAISNYRLDHGFRLSAEHEIVPRKLKGTVHAAWSYHEPSEGPVRALFETGLALVYKLLPQVDLTFDYVYRRQEAHDEVTSPGTPATGELTTDGDFDQHRVSIGINVWF